MTDTIARTVVSGCWHGDDHQVVLVDENCADVARPPGERPCPAVDAETGAPLPHRVAKCSHPDCPHPYAMHLMFEANLEHFAEAITSWMAHADQVGTDKGPAVDDEQAVEPPADGEAVDVGPGDVEGGPAAG